MKQEIYILDGVLYRVRGHGEHKGKLETKSGFSNVWMLTTKYSAAAEILAKGAKKQFCERSK